MIVVDHGSADRLQRVRLWVVTGAVTFAVLAPLAVLVGAAGARAQLFGLNVGFGWLAVRVAPALAVAGLVLGGLGLIAAAAPPRRGALASLFAIALSGASLGVLAQWRETMAKAPPVHDVSTDWTRTQLFSAKLMLARGPLANPFQTNPLVPAGPEGGALAGQYVGVVNARTCPAATPVLMALTPAKAYVRVKAAVLAARLPIVTDDAIDGVLEATRTSPLFGFKDDVSLSLHAVGAGTRVDMRASARTGQSDFGRNCQLVTSLRSTLSR